MRVGINWVQNHWGGSWSRDRDIKYHAGHFQSAAKVPREVNPHQTVGKTIATRASEMKTSSHHATKVHTRRNPLQASKHKLWKHRGQSIHLWSFQALVLYQADIFHITAVSFHFYCIGDLVTTPSGFSKVLLILNLNSKQGFLRLTTTGGIKSILL